MQSFPVLKALSGSQKVVKLFGIGLDKRQALILIGSILGYVFLYKQLSEYIALSTAQGVVLFSPLLIAAFVLAFGKVDGRHIDWWISRKWTNYLRPKTLLWKRRHPGRRGSLRDSVQEALPAEEILWEMLKTSGGEYLIAFEVEPVNLSLSGDSERERVWAATAQLYNRLDFPVVEMTRSREGNVATYVQTLHEHVLHGVSSEEESLAGFARHHLEFLSDIVKRYNVYDRTGYVILPYKPKDSSASSDLGLFWAILEGLGLWKKKPSAKDARRLQQEAEGAYRVLGDRAEIFHDGMYRVGARLRLLTGNDLLQLLKDQASGESPAVVTPAITAGAGAKGNGGPTLHEPVTLGEARYDRLPQHKLDKVMAAAESVRKDAPPAVGIGELTLSDKIAPDAIKVRPDYLRVGGRYHATLFVSEWPDRVHFGILQNLLHIPGRVKVVKYVKPLAQEKAVGILGSKVAELQAAEATAQDGNVISTQQRTTARFSAETAMDELISDRQRFLEVSVLVHCEADSKDELHSLVESVRTKLAGIRAEAKLAREESWEGYISTLPMGKNLLSSRYAAKGMLTDPLACLFVFGSYRVNHPEGILLGVDPISGGLIVLDSRELMNPHMIVIGTTGGGKSQSMKAISTRLRMRGQRVVMIDPVGNSKYGPVAKAVDGEYVVFGVGLPYKFNPCDLGTGYMNLNLLAYDADEEDPEEARRKARAAALDGKILMLTRLVSLMVASDDGSGGLTAGEQGLVDRLWAQVYAKKGITRDPDTHDLEPPTFQDFFAALAEAEKDEPRLAKLREQLYPWEAGALRTFFDSQTNVNLDNKYLVLQIAGVTGREKAAVMYGLLDFLNSKLSDPDEVSNCFIDEFWSLLEYPMSASFAEEMWRSGRARNNAMGAISQDVSEFRTTPQGEVILNISATHLILRQRKKTIERLSDFYDFSEEQKLELTNLQAGEGYLVVEENQIPLYVICSEEEMRLYNTDPKRELAYRETELEEGRRALTAGRGELTAAEHPQEYEEVSHPARRLSAAGRARQLLSDDEGFVPAEEDFEEVPGEVSQGTAAYDEAVAEAVAGSSGEREVAREASVGRAGSNGAGSNGAGRPPGPPEGPGGPPRGEEAAADGEAEQADVTPDHDDSTEQYDTPEPGITAEQDEDTTEMPVMSSPEHSPGELHEEDTETSAEEPVADSPAPICAVSGDTSALVAFEVAGLLAREATARGERVLLVDAEGSLSGGILSGIERSPTDELIVGGLQKDLDEYLMHEPDSGLKALLYPNDGALPATELIQRLRREFDLLVVPCGASQYATDWLMEAHKVVASAATARTLRQAVDRAEELRERNGTLLAPMGRLRLPEELACREKLYKLPSSKSAAFADAERQRRFAVLADQQMREAFEPLAGELSRELVSTQQKITNDRGARA